MAEISGRSLFLIAVLVIGVVGSIVIVNAEKPTEVFMTLSYQTDFEIELQPSSASVSQGGSASVGVVLTNNRVSNCGGPGNPCPNSLFQFEDAVVSLRTTGQVASGITVTFASSQVTVSGGQTKTVKMTVATSSSLATGAYSISVLADVSWSSYPGPTPYQVRFSLGVNVSATTTDASGQMSWTKSKVGETYGQLTINYKTGSPKVLKSSKTAQLALSGAGDITEISGKIFTLTVLPEKWPCVIANYPPSRAGEKQCSDDLLLGVVTQGELIIDGVSVFKKGPVTEYFYAKDPTHFLGIIGQWKKFKIGEPVHPSWDLAGFDPQPYFLKAYQAGKTSIHVELKYTQRWELVAFWLLPFSLYIPGITPIPIPTGIAYMIGLTDVPVSVSSDEQVLPPGAEADFGISASPTGIEVGTQANSWKDIQVKAMSINSDKHFEGTITFSTSGLPSGVTGTFSIASDAPDSGNGWTVLTVLRVTASSSTKLGGYDFKIIASGGGKTHALTIGLTIVENAEPPPNSMLVGTSLDIGFVQDVVKPSSEVTLKGALVDENARGLPNKDLQVTSSKFDLSKQVQTGSGGKFEVTFNAPENEGTYTVKATFAGDSTYSKTSENAILTVSISAAGTGDYCDVPLFGPLICGMNFLDWLKALTWGLPNIVWVAIILIVLYLVFRRSSGITVVLGGGGV